MILSLSLLLFCVCDEMRKKRIDFDANAADEDGPSGSFRSNRPRPRNCNSFQPVRTVRFGVRYWRKFLCTFAYVGFS